MSNYVPSTSLTTRRAPTTTSLLSSTPSQHATESLPTEARWWSTQFHLGPSSLVPTKATPTSSTRVTFVPTAMGSDAGGGPAASIVNHVSFAPNAVRGHPYQMAVSAGPRVCLYGGSQGGALFRALARVSNRRLSTEQRIDAFRAPSGDGDDNDVQDEQAGVKPDRSIPTGGVPVYRTAYHSDGRLIALGCDDGTIRVCDSTTRATLRTFSTSGKPGKRARGLPIRAVGWLPDGRKRKGASGDEAKKMLWSVGDDAVVRVWDLSGGVCLGGTGNGDEGMGDGALPILEMDGHGDSVRDCVVLTTAAAATADTLLVTGSYDHTVRVWSTYGIYDDAAAAKGQGRSCTSVMDHGAPVECLLAIQPPTTKHSTPSPQTATSIDSSADHFPIVLSAGGTTIKLWNPILGKCLSTIHTKHSKTITTLSMASIVREARIGEEHLQPARHAGRIVSRRLISAGLDGLVRVYSADGLFPRHNTDDPAAAGASSVKHDRSRSRSRDYALPYVHGVKTTSPITTIALSPCNNQLVIGTTLGTVTVRRRAKFVPPGTTGAGHKRLRRERPRVGTYSYFMRGKDVKADADDHVVGEGKRKKLRMFEKSLKAFQYGKALDEALKVRDVRGIIAVIEELSRRKGLVTALSNRDEVTLEPLLSFTATNIRVPHHTPVLIGVANILCDIYGDVSGQSEMIDEHFRKLRIHVENEVRNQKILLGLVGQIDAVMYQAEVGGGE